MQEEIPVKTPTLTAKAFIAGIMGMLSTPDMRFRLTPKVHIPTQEEVNAHARANPPFKRRRLEVRKMQRHG